MPGRNHAGMVAALLTAAPSRIATGTPESGTAVTDVIWSARRKPPWHTPKARPRPGSVASIAQDVLLLPLGGDDGGSNLGGFMLFVAASFVSARRPAVVAVAVVVVAPPLPKM
jgi:hypothetical protein